MAAPAHHAAAQAAARLNLHRGRDGTYPGRCPCCGYGKPTLSITVRSAGIVVGCVACGEVENICTVAGLPAELLARAAPTSSKIDKALRLWSRARGTDDTPVALYLRDRAITIPVPSSIGYIPEQRNWADRRSYAAMVSRVDRVTSRGTSGRLISTGVHITFLGQPDSNGRVRKAETKSS